ncbi:hypothetical protein Tco_0557947 [Tanacetum coccineum]
MSAKSKLINTVRYITVKVAGKPVSISEASIRSNLLFDDADGIDSLPNQVIFNAIQLMGTSWDQIPTEEICLTTNQKYNFSKLIFDGMMRHLDAKKKFVMYPRFISVFLDTQLKNVPVPLDHFPINALTSKVFSFMVKKGKHFSGNVTPLFESMLVQPTEDEGEASERQSEPQPTPSPPHPSTDQYETQPDLSPRPSPTIPDFIPDGSGGNHRDQSSSDRSLSGNEDGLTLQSVYDLCVSLYKQVTAQAKEIKHLKAQIKKLKKKAKLVITHHKAWMKSVSMKQRLAGKKSLKTKWMQKDFVMLGEKESTQKGVSTEEEVSTIKPDEGIDKSKVSSDKPEVSTAKPKEVEVSTDKLDKGTVEPKDETSDESTAPTTVFRDDETIAEFLVSMSQNKAKQKGVEIKDAEDSYRPRATSTRSVLTLKPLPKIDPKDKGKKVFKEEAESEAESEGVDEAERKFDQLVKDEEIARKGARGLGSRRGDKKARIEADRLLAARLQEEERETFTVEKRAKFLYDTIAAQRRFLAQQRAAVIRSRPLTRTQLRNQIMTYLKHVGGKKHADLKNKNFEEIQVLYKKVKRFDKDFIAIGSAEDERQIKEMNEEYKDLKKKRVIKETPKEEDTTKVSAEQEVTEQDDDSDDEHRNCLRIATFKSTIDNEIMETKSFVSKLHKVSSPDGGYLVIYRVNGHFRTFNYLMEVLHIFDRHDLFRLYDLVMKQYSKITPEEWEVFRWRLYEACRVCILELKDGTVIHMLVERRYPLSKELLQRMLDLGLEVEEESSDALHLDQTVPVQKQTAFGKDKSNPLIVDSLLKTTRLSIHLIVYNEELAILEQTATGKGISNPLMAGSLPKTTKPT